MEKINKLNADLLTARKEKNTLAKNLLSTFKGEYESMIKGTSPEGDATIEAIAKKMVKSAEQIGSEDALAEIEILKGYLPQILSEDETRKLVIKTMTDNNNLVEANNVGGLMGMVMKSGAKVDGKLVKSLIIEELHDIQA